MEKEKIDEYLESNLHSEIDDIFDNNDRMVLMSDVKNVVNDLINNKGKTYPPGFYKFNL